MSSIYGKYTITSVDGSSFPRIATVEFSAGAGGAINVEAKISNWMSGLVKLHNNNTLTGGLASTRRGGSPAQMKAEYALYHGFEMGMTYTKQNGVLTLKSAKHTIVLRSA